MGRVRIGAAIGESFRFLGEAWSRAWGILLLTVCLVALLQALETLRPTWFAVPLLSLLILVFASTAVAGALYRLRIAPDHPGDPAFASGPAGFQWGALEWRILGANLLVGLLIGVLVFVLFILWAVGLGFTIAANPVDAQAFEAAGDAQKMAALWRLMAGAAGVVTAAVLLPGLAGLLYLGARFALLTPLAAETGSFDFSKAWALTRGVVAALIVGALVIYGVELVIGVVVGAAGQLIAMKSGALQQGRLWASVVGQTISAAINVPLFSGLVLYVYRRQRGEPDVAATFS